MMIMQDVVSADEASPVAATCPRCGGELDTFGGPWFHVDTMLAWCGVDLHHGSTGGAS